MRKAYRTIDAVLNSPWAAVGRAEEKTSTDRVLHSTRLEDSIYADLRAGDHRLDKIEEAATKKLTSFPALARDIFQSFYSLLPRKNSEDELSVAARKFNAPLLEHIIHSTEFPALKAACEGRELPAYEAASEFIAQTAAGLDSLLADIGKDKLGTLEKLENAQAQAQDTLAALLERMRQTKERNKQLDQAVVNAANQAESTQRQVEAVGQLIDNNALCQAGNIAALVDRSLDAATERAKEVQAIIASWSDDPGQFRKTEANAALLEQVRKSGVLRNVSKYLGRFREIFAQGKRNSYTYGRGEKYSLELGRDLSRALTSELAMLALPQTVPLFLRKYQRGQIKQYQRREPVYKGMGDIICCLDESGSTMGDPAAWGKAVALTLLEIAAENNRSFALVHFSGPGSCKTDIFRPGAYTTAGKMAAAETFLDGGTNFETPMDEALRLMQAEHFEQADIVFITDGECVMPSAYLEKLRREQAARRFTVTGVLLDSDGDIAFSLGEFCQDIYRTSNLLDDGVVRELIAKRV